LPVEWLDPLRAKAVEDTQHNGSYARTGMFSDVHVDLEEAVGVANKMT
jgi:hypothetical protein